jgi:hypothetical protein
MASSAATKLAVVLLVLLATLIQGRQQAPVPPYQSTGRLKVTVLDTIDRIVPNVPITIEGNGQKRKFVSDEQLSHEFELPAGLYHITSQKGFGYFFPFRRAPFRVVPGNTTLINVTPSFRVLAIGTVLGEKDLTELAPEPKYQYLAVPQSLNPELSLLVQYDHRREYKRAVEYTDGERPFTGVIVSYDVIMICADKVRIEKDSLRIRAEGNVVIEDGKQRVHAKEKVLEFRTGIPTLLD